MSDAKKQAESTKETGEKDLKPTCGIVMPISEIDGCTAGHWEEVLSIITEVAESAGFDTKLVSEADDVGIIHKRIIQNVYNSDIIICDVSAKNPNVMFELGLRLAFDKATVIIKDDQTSYSFDTSPIEHLNYPRDLRFHKILNFKTVLHKKLLATLEKSKDETHSMYLKDFGQITVAKLDSKEVSKEDYLLDKLNELQSDIKLIRNESNPKVSYRASAPVTTSSSPSFSNLLEESYEDLVLLGLEKNVTNLRERISRKQRGSAALRGFTDAYLTKFLENKEDM